MLNQIRPASAPSQSRFARGVERRSLKKALSLLRRSDTYFKKALALVSPWVDRTAQRKGRYAPERLQPTAQRAGDILHKSRLLLLSGPRSLNQLLIQLSDVETTLLEFGSGVCVGGLFGRSMEPRMTKADALELLHSTVIKIKLCEHYSSVISTTSRKRLAELDLVKAAVVPRSESKYRREEPEPSSQFSSFLDQIKNRGWKVAEVKKEEPAEVKADLMAQSHDTVKRISGSYDSLLPDDVEVGLCQIPILLTRESKFSDNIKQALVDNGLEILTVYGSYTAISGLYLIGIHRRLMTVSDKEVQPRVKGAVPVADPYRHIPSKNGKKLDLVKFAALLPAVIGDNPDIEVKLNSTIPIGVPVKSGRHYYMPLLPKVLGRIPSFSLGEWQPLLTNKPNETKQQEN